jgi:hypothetical protein
MGRGYPGVVPSLTTQPHYFRQENGIRQPSPWTTFFVQANQILDRSTESMLASGLLFLS